MSSTTTDLQLPEGELSIRAQKLLDRLRDGRFYEAYGNKTPKAMQELVKAGLVGIAGRPVVVGAYYVPASGYIPYRPEVFEDRAIAAGGSK